MYDLAIIGGGPCGYTAAELAGREGLSVILFEKKELGGVCLNEGCIPTKSLLYGAKVYDGVRHADRYGVTTSPPAFNYDKAFDRKERVVKRLVTGIGVRLRNAGVETIKAEASVKGRDDEGIIIVAADAEYRSRNLLVCTGSEAAVPPFPGLETAGGTIVTSRELLSLREQPSGIVIIGGGVIGMEFASFFNSIGTKVTVVEMAPKILGPFDNEISAVLQDIYAKRGVDFRLNCKVTAIGERGEVSFEDAGGNVAAVSGEKILVSVGRRARLENLGLENLGVEYSLNRAGMPCGIKVDEHMRTNVPGVYAAGDVTGFSMLAHTASREGEVAVNDIMGKNDSMSYKAVPGAVYTNPEAACVGLTEEEARSKGIDCIVNRLPMTFAARFAAENDRVNGICKIVAGKRNHEILGVHMLGNPCSEIIHSACIAIEQGITFEQLRKTIFPHPSVSEIIRETANAG